ncbi:hypothetical protein GCM10009738_13790 [Kitasatospora viridis]
MVGDELVEPGEEGGIAVDERVVEVEERQSLHGASLLTADIPSTALNDRPSAGVSAEDAGNLLPG